MKFTWQRLYRSLLTVLLVLILDMDCRTFIQTSSFWLCHIVNLQIRVVPVTFVSVPLRYYNYMSRQEFVLKPNTTWGRILPWFIGGHKWRFVTTLLVSSLSQQLLCIKCQGSLYTEENEIYSSSFNILSRKRVDNGKTGS